MKIYPFRPHHINANENDIAGNDGLGRYFFLPGSDGRAKKISEHFNKLTIKPHGRGHNLYMGTVFEKGMNIDVAAISTGMGCASMEIVLHELIQLGAKRFLRIGTAGAMQDQINIGDIVNVSAAVRDEQTSLDYFPPEIPVLASLDMILAVLQSARNSKLEQNLHTGIVHCKSSFYAREFGIGPRGSENLKYINLLTECGVLATEMETSALFAQTQFHDYKIKKEKKDSKEKILSGAILGIISKLPNHIATHEEIEKTENKINELGIATIKTLAALQ